MSISKISVPGLDEIAKSYDVYYSSGFYETRYPMPNPNMLRRVKSLIGSERSRVLDFGCGDGRYAVPLVKQTNAHVIAYDISPAGVGIIEKRCPDAISQNRLTLLHGDFEVLKAAVESGPPLDVALLMFGVITHIRGRQQRIDILASIRKLMRPNGKLVLTAANRGRRFKEEQVALASAVARGDLESGDIVYHRIQGDNRIDLYMHAYEQTEFVEDLKAAGLRVLELGAESIMQESTVVSSNAAAMLDRALQWVLPVDAAYDFMAVCEIDS